LSTCFQEVARIVSDSEPERWELVMRVNFVSFSGYLLGQITISPQGSQSNPSKVSVETDRREQGKRRQYKRNPGSRHRFRCRGGCIATGVGRLGRTWIARFGRRPRRRWLGGSANWLRCRCSSNVVVETCHRSFRFIPELRSRGRVFRYRLQCRLALLFFFR
jgi:hypothetical protein